MKALQSFAFFLIFAFFLTSVECLHLSILSINSLRKIIFENFLNYQNKLTHLRPPPIKCDFDWKIAADKFNEVFVDKDTNDHAGYFRIFNSEKIIDKGVFYSKVKDIANGFTYLTNTFLTIENTHLGYPINGLIWCDSCVKWYWELASKEYAKMIQGKAIAFLNGDLAPDLAFDKNSIFRKIELPTIIEYGQVNELVVPIVTNATIIDYGILVNFENLSRLISSVTDEIGRNYDRTRHDMKVTFYLITRSNLFLLSAQNPTKMDFDSMSSAKFINGEGYLLSVHIPSKLVFDSMSRANFFKSKESLGKIKKARKVRKARKHDN